MSAAVPRVTISAQLRHMMGSSGRVEATCTACDAVVEVTNVGVVRHYVPETRFPCPNSGATATYGSWHIVREEKTAS